VTTSGESSAYPARVWAALPTIGLNVMLYAAAITVTLLLSALLLTVVGASPASVFTAMYNGSLRGGASIGQTLDESTPILLVALGVVIATRGGIINIGTEGQLIFGAMVGAAVGLFVPGPGPIILVLTLAATAAGGALWAGIAALLRFSRGVDVVISTLLLNFIAFEVVSFAVNRDWLLRETRRPGEITVPQSDQLPESVRLPRLGEFPDLNVHSGLFIALALVVIVTVALFRTRWGFRLRMLGLNPVTAHRAGVGAVAVGGGALLLSGAFAGLGGGVMLTGSVFRIQSGFSNNVGFDGLLTALVARRNPIAAVPVAIFFGMLRSGGTFLSATGVPRFLVAIVQALLVLAALFPPVFIELQRRRRDTARARSAARGELSPA
jgi:general nucleoside transport system permease protein